MFLDDAFERAAARDNFSAADGTSFQYKYSIQSVGINPSCVLPRTVHSPSTSSAMMNSTLRSTASKRLVSSRRGFVSSSARRQGQTSSVNASSSLNATGYAVAGAAGGGAVLLGGELLFPAFRILSRL